MPPDVPAPARPRWQRWLYVVAALMVLLAAYAIALRWFSDRIGVDMERNLRDAPAIDDARHRRG